MTAGCGSFVVCKRAHLWHPPKQPTKTLTCCTQRRKALTISPPSDIASFSWVNVAYFAGVDLASFPNLHKWWERIWARPAVQKGCAIPSESKFINAAYQQRLKEEPEFKEQEEKLAKIGREAKEEYGYKYSSP